MPQHRAPSRRPAILAALATLAGAVAFALAPGRVAPVADPSPLSVVAECQGALGYASRSAADAAWLSQCVSALTPPLSSTTPPVTTPPATSTAPATTPPATTTTPATTPPATTPPATRVGCIAHPSACGWPDATNTGVPAGTTLTIVNGDQTYRTAGQVISGLDIRGCVRIAAAGITIKNSRITCSGAYVVDTEIGGAPLILADVTIDCGGSMGTGLGERNILASRLAIGRCVNGGDFDQQITLQDSYIHDLVGSGGAHADGIQANANAVGGTKIIHNTIDAAGDTTSAIITALPPPGTTNLTVADNLLRGGAYTLYCSNNPMMVSGNRFSTFTYGPTDRCGVAHWAGNVSDLTGKPLLPS